MAAGLGWRRIAAAWQGRGGVRKRAAAWLAAAALAAGGAGGRPLGGEQAQVAQAPPAGSSSVEAPAPPAEKPEELTTVFRHPEGRLWIAGQMNFIFQGNLSFHAPYSGPNSL